MGIGGQIVDAIAREHAYRPIVGDVLLIGRQTTYFTPDALIARLKEHGHSADPSKIEIDRSTINRLSGFEQTELVTDKSIFWTLGVDRVRALDISDYEGAEVLHNLNEPLPPHLRGIADFIVDGSTLDNTFNPALTLRNFAELLRPGGRLIGVNSYGVYETAYVIMPPMWFFDYFLANDFGDFKIYVSVNREDGTNVFYIDPGYLRKNRRSMSRLPSPFQNSTVVFAEKGPDSTSHKIPTQQHYRPADEWASYMKRLAAVEASPRPHVARSYSDLHLTDLEPSYVYVDRYYREHRSP